MNHNQTTANFDTIIKALNNHEVIAYPTEAVLAWVVILTVSRP